MLQSGYGVSHQFQMEIAYTRSEIGRYTHCLREWEAREKDLHIRYGLATPMTQSETDAATIGLLENRMNAMARDHAGYVDILNKQLLQQKDVVRERDYEVQSLAKKIDGLEAEKKRLIIDYEKIIANLKRDRSEDIDPTGDWMESRPSRRTAAMSKKGAPFSYEEDGKLWTNVIRSVYPKFKTTSSGPYSTFSKNFRVAHLGSQPKSNGTIPKEFHKAFIEAFEKEFAEEIGAFLDKEEDSISTISSSSPPLEQLYIDPNSTLFTIWKDVIRKELPNYRFDTVGLEKRIRLGLTSFLSTACANTSIDYRQCLPTGNSSRQHVIPEELLAAFLEWFKEQDKNGFRNFDGKRKADSFAETAVPVPKRQKSDPEVHEPIDLSFCSKSSSDMDELLHLDSLEQLLVSANGKSMIELKPKIKIWLLLKLGEKFPSCAIDGTTENPSSFGIPKYLKE